jgi:outer membrane protein
MNFKVIAAAIFTTVVLAACGDKKDTKTNKASTPTIAATAEGEKIAGLKVAYVNIDTLNEQYEYLKEKEAAFKKKQDAYEVEMSNKEKALQNEFMSFQKKAQEGTLTQSEGEAAQKRLAQQQQALEKRHAAISNDMAKEQMAIQEDFQKRLDSFLEKFNEEHGYDFIFKHSKVGGPVLFANPAFDITDEIVNAMNEDYKNSGKKVDSKKEEASK